MNIEGHLSKLRPFCPRKHHCVERTELFSEGGPVLLGSLSWRTSRFFPNRESIAFQTFGKITAYFESRPNLVDTD